jgi:hypothetical protein
MFGLVSCDSPKGSCGQLLVVQTRQQERNLDWSFEKQQFVVEIFNLNQK